MLEASCKDTAKENWRRGTFELELGVFMSTAATLSIVVATERPIWLSTTYSCQLSSVS